MELIFTSRNRSLYEAFSKIFCSENDYVAFYDDMVEFSADFIAKRFSPAIIIIDSLYFGRFKNFVFRLLNDSRQKIPAIFIDDKIPSNVRAAKWLSEIELFFDNPNYQNVIPLLEKVSRILDLPACKKARALADDENRKNPMEIPLRKKFLLTPVNHLLYEYFFKNRRRIVYLDEIAEILKVNKNDNKTLRNGIYAYVSRFRKSIALTNCQYELVRICKGGYQFMLKN